MYKVSISNIKAEVKWNEVLIFSFLFICFPPILGVSILIFYYMMLEKASKTHYYLFFACIALYLGVINATKEPGSGGDQFRYCIAYLNVPKLGFWKSLIYIYGNEYEMNPNKTHISGEFMNGVYNYVGYYITFGKYCLFAMLYTFIEYMLFFSGLYKFCQTMRKPHIPIVCGVLILSFFYLFFQYTLHIQKQFFAQAIMMYVIGSVAYEGKMSKKLWVLAVMSIFTHASMILFIPFLYLDILKQSLNKRSLLFIAAAFSCLIIIGPAMAGSVVSGNASSGGLSYGINRIASSVGYDDGFGLNMLQVVVIGIPMGLILIKKLWFQRKNLSNNEAFVLNIVFLLLLAVAAMFNQPLAQYRYFMMVFAFMPFVYPFAFETIALRNTFLKVLAIVMIVWFYYQFESIIYNYCPVWNIIFTPPIGILVGYGWDF